MHFRFIFHSVLLLAAYFSTITGIGAPQQPEDIGLIGYLKCRSLPLLGGKIKQTIQSLPVDVSFPLLLATVPAMEWGYPEFSGISKNENVSTYFFDDPQQGIIPILVLQIAKDSPLRKLFAEKKWLTLEQDNFTVLCQSAELLQRVKDFKALIKHASKPFPNGDFKLRLYAKKIASRVEDILKNYKGAKWVPLVSSLCQEAKDVKSLTLTSSLDKNHVHVCLNLYAYNKTPLAKFFAQSTDNESSELLRFLPKENILGVLRYDSTLVCEYTNYLISKCIAAYQASIITHGPAITQSLEALKKALNTSLSLSSTGYVLSCDTTRGGANCLLISKTRTTEAELCQHIPSLPNAWHSVLKEIFEKACGFSYTLGAKTVGKNGTSIYSLKSTEVFKDKKADETAKEGRESAEPFSQNYFSLCQGVLVVGNPLDRVQGVLHGIFEAKALSNNAASFAYPPNTFFKMSILKDAKSLDHAPAKEGKDSERLCWTTLFSEKGVITSELSTTVEEIVRFFFASGPAQQDFLKANK